MLKEEDTAGVLEEELLSYDSTTVMVSPPWSMSGKLEKLRNYPRVGEFKFKLRPNETPRRPGKFKFEFRPKERKINTNSPPP